MGDSWSDPVSRVVSWVQRIARVSDVSGMEPARSYVQCGRCLGSYEVLSSIADRGFACITCGLWLGNGSSRRSSCGGSGGSDRCSNNPYGSDDLAWRGFFCWRCGGRLQGTREHRPAVGAQVFRFRLMGQQILLEPADGVAGAPNGREVLWLAVTNPTSKEMDVVLRVQSRGWFQAGQWSSSVRFWNPFQGLVIGLVPTPSFDERAFSLGELLVSVVSPTDSPGLDLSIHQVLSHSNTTIFRCNLWPRMTWLFPMRQECRGSSSSDHLPEVDVFRYARGCRPGGFFDVIPPGFTATDAELFISLTQGQQEQLLPRRGPMVSTSDEAAPDVIQELKDRLRQADEELVRANKLHACEQERLRREKADLLEETARLRQERDQLTQELDRSRNEAIEMSEQLAVRLRAVEEHHSDDPELLDKLRRVLIEGTLNDINALGGRQF